MKDMKDMKDMEGGHRESLYQVATLLLQSAWKYPSSPCITSKPAPPTLPAFHGVPGHFVFLSSIV